MRKFDNINVIPFIDIMLVLLAIVLTTATFVNNGQLDITLPETGGESQEARPDLVRISIDAEEKYYLDDQALSIEDLQKKLSVLDKQTPVNLEIDQSVAFEKFILIIELLKQLSLDQVSILTQKPR